MNHRLQRSTENSRPNIVAAYVRHNQIGADQLPIVISTVHQALAGLGKSKAETEMERTPAVPIRRSVHRDYVVCLECGWRGQMLKRHITTGHGLTVAQYRARWNLSRAHEITAPGYSERRSGLAKQIGLGRGRRASREETEPIAPEIPTAEQPRSRRRGRARSATTETEPGAWGKLSWPHETIEMEIRDAIPEDAPAACEVLRRSISELCGADHRNDPVILGRWLANKTPEIVASWTVRPENSVLVAVEDGSILGGGLGDRRGRDQSQLCIAGCKVLWC
jgi:predicted transcriptional regulator